jgi:TetR/AcrR family transcriptional regulator
MVQNTATARSQVTRARIVEAAVEAFSSHGFEGATTRQIAALAGENQGLITYHFANKETLWKAAVDSLFSGLVGELAGRVEVLADADVRTRLRLFIYYFVRYAARHPEQMRLMVQEGKADSHRMEWLVDRHLKRLYEFYSGLVCDAQRAGVLPEGPAVHLYYILIGATSLIFTAAPECIRLTGTDPMQEDAIEAHAEVICNLLLR